MVHKYVKAIISGIFGIIWMIILFMAMAFLFTRSSGPSDSGPAAVGAAFIFGIVVLVSMVFIGIFSAWWALGKNPSINGAVEVSALAGAIPTIALCLIILVFELIESTYSPTREFSFSTFLNTLNSGLTVCCAASFFTGILLSVAGGMIYVQVLPLFRKRGQTG